MQTAARRRSGGAVSDTTMVATMGGCPAVDSLPGGRSACGPADLQTARVLWVGLGSGTPWLCGGLQIVVQAPGRPDATTHLYPTNANF